MRACHDLSEGGLALAVAEMCLAGRLGASIALERLQVEQTAELEIVELLFGESNGRLLIEVDPGDAAAVEQIFAGEPLTALGEVTAEQRLSITINGNAIVDLGVERLVQAWKG